MKILPTLLLMLLPFYVFGVYGCSDDNSGDEQIQKFTLAEVDLQQNFNQGKGRAIYTGQHYPRCKSVGCGF